MHFTYWYFPASSGKKTNYETVLQMLKKIAFHLKLKILKLQTHILEKSEKWEA